MLFDIFLNVAFNRRMDPKETIALIDAAGGDTAFGRLLGIDETDGFQQRINNWRRRGMPAAIILEHYELIQSLRSQSKFVPRCTNSR